MEVGDIAASQTGLLIFEHIIPRPTARSPINASREQTTSPTHRVVANLGRTLAVAALDVSDLEHGTPEAPIQASPLRQLPLIVTGDRVRVEFDKAGSARVVALEPRTTVLERAERHGKFKPLAANLTHLGVVSAAPPGIDTLLIDEFCVAARRSGLGALIIINKYQSLPESERRDADEILAAYRAAGHVAIACEANAANGIDALQSALSGRVVALVGASGVGKSSIVSRLLPERDVRVGAVSAATGLGAHTTSVTLWYDLPMASAGALVDSAGVRRWSVEALGVDDVKDGYGDIAELATACRFNDCRHHVEPGCAVTEALQDGSLARFRYENFCKLSAMAE